MFRPTILVDFDITISPVHGFYEPPCPDVVTAIKTLSQKYNICIYSTRCNEDLAKTEGLDAMIQYLKDHEIPFNSICENKPIFCAVIDDRSFNPDRDGWDKIVSDLMKEVT